MREKLEQAVREALLRQGYEGQPQFVVERPRDMGRGDYATNAALVAKVDAQELADHLNIDGVEKVEVVGKFINFFLAREALIKEVEAAAKEEEWGTNELYKGKKIMVEYTDPNPFKEFHIGHLMSNAIGEAIARVLEAAGADVKRANYQGDVGLHVAKAIWGRENTPFYKDASWGISYMRGDTAYKSDPKVKEKIDEINKKIYEKDPEIDDLYQLGRKESLEEFEKIYQILGTKFDSYFFESETTPFGTKLVNNNSEVFEESDGARVFRGEEEGLHTRVFLTSQGLPTYEAKDLGLLEMKSKETLDTFITVTASEQKEYFKVVLAAAKHIESLKDIAEKTTHVTHGMMRFADAKMSSRLGNIITGKNLLSWLAGDARAKMEGRELADADKVAEQVAVGAVKYAVLKQSSGKDIVFDPEKSLSLEGDSGPYVQYARVRAQSLIEKAQEAETVEYSAVTDGQDYAELGLSTKLQRLLVHYPEVVLRSAKELEPHYITTYLTELAAVFNSWYATERVIVDGKVGSHVLTLVQAVEQTLAKGLHILGIPAPEKM